MAANLVLPSWYTLSVHDCLPSTNDEAKRLAANEMAPEGMVVWAKEQTAGRGRQSRIWISKPGNLFCSVILRPDCVPARVSEISFVVPVAAREALADLATSHEFLIKWPNDLLIDGRKIGGILIESTLREGGVESVVAGVGLNLVSYPEGTEFPATSLQAVAGIAATTDAALAAFCARFQHWYHLWRIEGFQPIREAWLENCHPVGTDLMVRQAGGFVTGAFHGLDDGGALLLDRAGKIERFESGDISFTGLIRNTDQYAAGD